MADQAILTTAFTNKAHDNMVSQFRQEFLSTQALYKIQPDIVHRFLEVQAMTIAESIIQGLPHVKFSLPDRVSTKLHGDIVETLAVPPDWRVHTVGGKMDRLIRSDLRALLRSRFMELERSLDPAVSTSAVLLRYS